MTAWDRQAEWKVVRSIEQTATLSIAIEPNDRVAQFHVLRRHVSEFRHKPPIELVRQLHRKETLELTGLQKENARELLQKLSENGLLASCLDTDKEVLSAFNASTGDWLEGTNEEVHQAAREMLAAGAQCIDLEQASLERQRNFPRELSEEERTIIAWILDHAGGDTHHLRSQLFRAKVVGEMRMRMRFRLFCH